MRNLDFMWAGFLVLAALYAKFAGHPWWVPVLLLVLAAARMYTGMRNRARELRLRENPIVLTEEQVHKVREMKQRGEVVAAIKQVRLWYRDADLLTAKQLVDAA